MEETIGTWMDVGKFYCNVLMMLITNIPPSLLPPRSHSAESWTVEALRLPGELSRVLSGQAGRGGLHLAATLRPGSSPQTTGGGNISPDLSALTESHFQVAAFVSQLTPEQLRLKQQLVIDHVKQEAVKQGLSAVEAEAMLAQTLEYNGLPQVSSNPITGALDNLFKIGSNTVNKIGLPAPTQTASQSASQDLIPGLPVPGTLEHSVTLALFNAQQFINQALSGSSQPAIDNKLGVAAGATEPDGSLASAVSSLPASLSNAAVQVLKFVGQPPPSSTGGTGGTGGQSYSEVVTGVDPSYAALGVLTTGALASVAFSYVASDSDIASSATDLALGAVDALARNDIVQNIANNDLVERITNNDIVRKAQDAISNNKLLRKATSAIASIKNKLSGNRDGNYDPTKFYNIDNADYGDYGAGLYQTNFDYYQELAYSDRYPYQESRVSDQSEYSDDDGWHLEEPWDDTIEWFEPEKSAVPETVPHVPYSEDHNPWHLMNTGQSTDHLYRGFTD